MLEKFANNAADSLNGAITNSQTTLVVHSATLFPSTPQFRLIIGQELLLVTGVAGTTFTVTRGAESTTAASHADGSPVTHILTAGAINQISGLNGPVTATQTTITSSYTVDSSEGDYFIYCNHSAAINLTLPAPTQGRIIIVQDISGAAETNNITLVRHASENINGLAASRVLQTNWGMWTITSDGTNWVL